jgi:hypothetical protein
MCRPRLSRCRILRMHFGTKPSSGCARRPRVGCVRPVDTRRPLALSDLSLETRRLRLRRLFILAWTSALTRRRGIIGGPGDRLAAVWLVLDRLLARLDLGGVAHDRPDDASPERTLDQRGVDLVWQFAACEFGERPRKRGFGRNLRASLESRGCDAGTRRRRGARSGRWW